jgi:polyisoprenoid-binding protein YceI
MRKLLLIVPITLVVLVAGGVLLYTKVIADDPPERLTFESGTTVPGATTASSAGVAATGGIDGTWKVTSPSQAGYRAKEILFGQSVTAVGRTSDVTGEMTIQGTTVSTASFSVDMTTVKSDSNQRDGQFRGRIMETSQFPTATFTLSSPISVGSLPADKTETTVQAKGKLTLKGKTNDVTFDLKARRNGSTIEVNGTIPVRFPDYGIENPSGGPAQVGDDGEVEVLLVFTKG